MDFWQNIKDVQVFHFVFKMTIDGGLFVEYNFLLLLTNLIQTWQIIW